MPSLFDKQKDTNSPLLLREFFYGPQKTRKTWLAGTAAEAGFNTILLDADHGYHILQKQLSDPAKKRLRLIECRDTLNKAIACEFMTRLLKNENVLFDDATKDIVYNRQNLPSTCIELDVYRHLNKNTVLIVDSYTAICASLVLRYSVENKDFDLTDPKMGEAMRPVYAFAGALASFILQKLSQLPCHVIVIGHATVYEKYKKDHRGKQVPDWTRRIIKSTSGPHSMTITDKFSDILYFHNISSALTKIDTYAEKDAEGGSRIIPPASYSWDKLQWKDICNYADIPLPPKDLPYLDFTPNTTTGGSNNEAAKLINSNPGLTKVKGLETKTPIQKTTSKIIIKK